MPDPMLIAKCDRNLFLLPGLANRHGLITGATGTGKTVTLQRIAEQLSRAGVPVFMADVKGDLSGMSQAGAWNPKLKERAEKLGLGDGVASIFKLKRRGMFLLYTTLIWGCYWFLVLMGFWSMSQLEHLPGLGALVVLIFGSIGMITTQGGIGAYPYLVGKILVFYGIPEVYGLAFGWVSWTVQTGVVVVFGVLSLILLPIYNNRRANDA